MIDPVALDPVGLLHRVAKLIPSTLRSNVVVIGSIATAWSFRELQAHSFVSTKDIDAVLRPHLRAVATAESIGQDLLDQGWRPHFTGDMKPGTTETADDKLPALRLKPPGGEGNWFIELLAEPGPDQQERRAWTRFETSEGFFGLPSFRYLPVAVHDAVVSDGGLQVARPANMALAHLLEHADPDRNAVSTMPGVQRFVKDIGRAVSLWWLAQEANALAESQWHVDWVSTVEAIYPGQRESIRARALRGHDTIRLFLQDAHQLSVRGVLAPYNTPLSAYERAYDGLGKVIQNEWMPWPLIP